MTTATLRDQLADALVDLLGGNKERGYKHDAPGSPATTLLHGPGGLLRYPGVDPDMFQTIIGSLPGVMSALPTRATVFTDPTYQILTGIDAGSGAEPTNDCDDAPIGGVAHACLFTAPFGRIQRSTKELAINTLGQRTDRADPVDLRLIGGPIGRGPFTSMEIAGNILNNDFDMAMYERAVEFHRVLSSMVWTGNPSGNTPTGGYKEFAGLELMVNTGWKDAITGNACDNADPDIKDFNYLEVSANGDSLVHTLATMHHYLRDKAMRTRVAPVRWAIAMRPELFWELTSVWPCSYFTTVCNGAAGNLTQNIDAADQVRMRDEMRAGSYLMLNGERLEVIQDDGISADTNTTNGSVTSGCFASDIFFLPMSVQGGARATLYFEYFDFGNPSIQSALDNGMVLARPFSTPGGAFLEVPRQTNWCFQLQAKIEPRIILRTPWLAGRLQNVQYCPLQVPDQPFPDQPYFKAADGEAGRSGPSYYATW